jgi:hypothetical protein
MTGKPKLEWRFQDVGALGNVKYLLRKAVGNEWSQHRRQPM